MCTWFIFQHMWRGFHFHVFGLASLSLFLAQEVMLQVVDLCFFVEVVIRSMMSYLNCGLFLSFIVASAIDGPCSN